MKSYIKIPLPPSDSPLLFWYLWIEEGVQGRRFEVRQKFMEWTRCLHALPKTCKLQTDTQAQHPVVPEFYGDCCGVGWWSLRRGVVVVPVAIREEIFFEGVPYSTVIKSDFRVVFPCRWKRIFVAFWRRRRRKSGFGGHSEAISFDFWKPRADIFKDSMDFGVRPKDFNAFWSSAKGF